MNKFGIMLRSVAVSLLLQPFLCSASCEDRHETLSVENGTQSVSDEVPTRPGMTLKGRVVAESGNGLSGVVVSDGIITTETDGDGCYWASVAKRNRLCICIGTW